MSSTASLVQAVKVATDAQLAEISKQLRVIAQAGAQVVYDDLHTSLDRALKSAPYYTRTGNLKRAIYQAWRKEKSGDAAQFYAVSYAGNAKLSKKGASQHAHLLEFGHEMRYQLVKNKNGQWVTARRRESFGKPAPKRSASTATKDAFFVLRKEGPRRVQGQPWFTPVLREGSPSQGRALQAIERKFQELFA